MTISVHSLDLAYPTSDQAIVANMDAELDLTSITAIIGPNGCGKSTLLRGLLGLMSPANGKIVLDGEALTSWSAKRLARRIAFLPQSPSAPDGLTLRQIVGHGRFAHKGLLSGQTREDVSIIEEALHRTGLDDLADRPFSTLSGGERQRGWIALALAQKAKAIFLDEPTTFLDIGHQHDILDLVRELNQQDGIGIVMVLHDINQAAAYADRVIALDKGAIVADGRGEDIITAELMESLFKVKVQIQHLDHGTGRYPHCIPLASHMRA